MTLSSVQWLTFLGKEEMKESNGEGKVIKVELEVAISQLFY